MPASLYTHAQLVDEHGHRPYHHVTVTVPAGDPRRRKPTTRTRRVYDGRVERVDEPTPGAAVQRDTKPRKPATPLSTRQRESRYLETGRSGLTPRQRRRSNHKDNAAKLRAEKAGTP